jgi:hypothetical protein
MRFTPGQVLFYGGITGMLLVIAAAITVIVVFSGSRKRLRRKFNEEYGSKDGYHTES